MGTSRLSLCAKGIFFLSLLSFLYGCQSPKNLPSQTVVPSQTLIASTILATRSAPTKTSLFPTSTFRITTTPLLPTVTPNVTATIKPTLNPSDSLFRILRILQDNGGCELPCIWGIEPGNPVNKFEGDFAEFLDGAKSDQKIHFFPFSTNNYKLLKLQYSRGNFVYTISLIVYFSNKNPIDQVELKILSNEDALLSDTPASTLNTPYSISQILTDYGQPSEILIAPFPQSWGGADNWQPSFLVMVYEDSRFFAVYETTKARLSGHYQGCFSNSQVLLTSWLPDSSNSWHNALAKLSSTEVNLKTIHYFKPLSEASNITVDAFYEQYRSSKNQVCIQTPTGIWPNSLDPK